MVRRDWGICRRRHYAHAMTVARGRSSESRGDAGRSCEREGVPGELEMETGAPRAFCHGPAAAYRWFGGRAHGRGNKRRPGCTAATPRRKRMSPAPMMADLVMVTGVSDQVHIGLIDRATAREEVSHVDIARAAVRESTLTLPWVDVSCGVRQAGVGKSASRSSSASTVSRSATTGRRPVAGPVAASPSWRPERVIAAAGSS